MFLKHTQNRHKNLRVNSTGLTLDLSKMETLLADINFATLESLILNKLTREVVMLFSGSLNKEQIVLGDSSRM